ncbi:MAG TPA: Usg family protein [Alphaproteobacteria bacterium]|nr:Usg family protein [Alphaproteobacteria bacterium]
MRTSAAILGDYRLTTAEILYHLPDFPTVLQSFIWQQPDLSPDYPMLRRFLAYWERHLDGKLHSVRIASKHLVRPAEIRYASCQLRLH